MKKLPLTLIAIGLALLPASAAITSTLPQIALNNGRVLNGVEVKSYDPVSGKFHLIADGKAQLIHSSLLPVSLAAELQKAAPQPGLSTNILQPAPPLSQAQRAEILAQRARAAELHTEELARATAQPTPAPAPRPAYRPARIIDRCHPAYSGIYYTTNNRKHWRDCDDSLRKDNCRRDPKPSLTPQPPPPINDLPSGPVRVITSVR